MMDYMRDSVRLRAYGQRDPLVEYKNESVRMLRELTYGINENIVQTLFRVEIRPAGEHNHEGHQHGHAHQNRNTSGITSSPTTSKKIGRNAPCPCGSGKKYKKCGMIGSPDHKG